MSAHPILRFSKITIVMATVGLISAPAELLAQRDPSPRHYKFDIDAKTPAADLLPTLQTAVAPPAYLNENLDAVAELAIGGPVSRNRIREEEMAHVIAKINHLNGRQADGFLKALAIHRADLRGLPYLMGEDCTTEEKQAQLFTETVTVVQELMRNIALQDPEGAAVPNEQLSVEIVRREFARAMAVKTDEKSRRSQAAQVDRDRADVAALTQMFAPKPGYFRAGLARHLATVKHKDATSALVKLALFAPEKVVRQAAIAGLKERPAADYAKILVQGLHYPLPAVSTRAANAIVQLECKEVLADLVDVLEKPDPRAPFKQTIDGKEVTVVRELVRINHNRNCLLCHAPANTEGVPKDVLTVPVPLPGSPISAAIPYYSERRSPDIFVRADVTYLRQDFALMMRVEKADPWPEMQRFDFLVRTRVLSPDEAAVCNQQIARQGTPPNHWQAQQALHALTGRPTAATPQEWRRILGLTGRKTSG
jgi:hypothetical protein